ncbi:glutamine-rich protein 2 [Latimeria chalumnae]|uniref:glutamine-rich protein 2 n=1 Tax=Latimeria chalumnae TaxID=7897 RepID=UPI00313D04DB
MTSVVTLFDLVNLSIGTPEVGAVNFNALHTLLHAMLKHFKIQDVQTELKDQDFFQPPPSQPLAPEPGSEKAIPSPYHQMEKKILEIEKQIEVFSRLPSGEDLLKRASADKKDSPVNDMWHLMQLRKKVEASTEGVSKAMSLLQDLVAEISGLKSSRDSMDSALQKLGEGMNFKELLAHTAELEKRTARMQDLDKLLSALQQKVDLFPNPEELGSIVTWDILQETLVPEKATNQGIYQQPQGINQPPPQVIQPSSQGTSWSVTQPTSHPTTQPMADATGQLPTQATIQSHTQLTTQSMGQPTTQQVGQAPSQPVGQTTGQTPSQPTGQTIGRTPSQLMGQTPGQPTGQTPGQIPSQPMGQAPGQLLGQPTDQVPGHSTGQAPGQVPSQPMDQVPGQFPAQQVGQAPGQFPAQQVGQGQAPGQFPTQQVGQGQVPGQFPTQQVGQGQVPGQFPTQQVGQVPGQFPTQQVGQVPGQFPTQQVGQGQVPGQLPTQQVGQVPGQFPTQQVGQGQGQAPGQFPTQQVGQVPSQFPAQQVGQGQAPGQFPAQQVGQGQAPGQFPTQQVGQAPGQFPAQQVGQGQAPGQFPTQQVGQAPGQFPAQQVGQGQAPGQFPAQQVGQAPGQFPAQQVGQAPGQFPTQQVGQVPVQPTSRITTQASDQSLKNKTPSPADSRPPSSRTSSSASERYPEAVDALRNLGKLRHQHGALKEKVIQLEKAMPTKVDVFRFEELKAFVEEQNRQLLDQKLELKDLRKDTEEMKDHQKETDSLASQVDSLAHQVAALANQLMGANDEKVEGALQINSQIEFLRSTVGDIEKKLNELRDQQELGKLKLEQSVTDTEKNLQEQLDKLRSILENMMSSTSALLNMSKSSDPHATCPACSIEVGKQVSQLVKRYEQLQELISNIMSNQETDKDAELLNHVQNAILLLQAECEKLNSTAGDLIEDHNKKQDDIDHLYETVEKLEEKKADKEIVDMEIDVKADKFALANKVSRTQFDSTTEQLGKMIQDLLSKMSVQEQDWQKVIEKISTEMECKLDRLEIDPLKKMLEERWKSIRKQLKERSPSYEADEAAGIRKQLIARFHCLSCDKPVNMIPGPHMVTVPSLQGLPSHRSNRPHTVYELEQIRHHAKCLKPGTNYANYEAALMEKNAASMRRIHTMLCKQIERVQNHFGGVMRAHSHMIKDFNQSRCPNSYRRGFDSSARNDRMAEVTDYGYLASNRSCGGSHTLTFPHRRFSRLQHIAQCIQQEEQTPTILRHKSVDILGLDGHIYKGRIVENRLPSITGEDVNPENSKVNVSSSQQIKAPYADSSRHHQRAQSARAHARSRPASARSLKERPMSSQGRLSQSSFINPSIPQQPLERNQISSRETFDIRMGGVNGNDLPEEEAVSTH